MKRSLLWILASTVGVALSLLFVATLISAQGDVPVFKFNPEVSVVNFNVSASVPIEGKFNNWDATLTFTSRELSTGVLDIKIDAASVDTGSGMKDGKLKGKDFFDVKNNPYVTFHSSKIEQTGPNSFDVSGTFTIRGVSKPEKLTFSSIGKGTGEGEIKGTMAFDRKEFGMNSGIPFIKIADRCRSDRRHKRQENQRPTAELQRIRRPLSPT